MAIQAQRCSENLGFSSMRTQNLAGPHGGGDGGGGGVGQYCQNPLQNQQWRQSEQQKQNHKQPNGIQIQNQIPSFAANFQAFPLQYTSGAAIDDQTPPQFHRSIPPSIEIETADLDQYIKLQNESLALVLQEQVKKQVSSVLKMLESKATFLLRQKEERTVHAAKRTVELEEMLRKLETEKEAWQRAAQENEATIISLNNTLDQMRETASRRHRANAAEDAVSCCVGETEEATMDANRSGREWPVICSWCNSRNSSVLFLPCRHLCSCQACEAVLNYCPICFTEISAAIEALIF